MLQRPRAATLPAPVNTGWKPMVLWAPANYVVFLAGIKRVSMASYGDGPTKTESALELLVRRVISRRHTVGFKRARMRGVSEEHI